MSSEAVFVLLLQQENPYCAFPAFFAFTVIVVVYHLKGHVLKMNPLKSRKIKSYSEA